MRTVSSSDKLTEYYSLEVSIRDHFDQQGEDVHHRDPVIDTIDYVVNDTITLRDHITVRSSFFLVIEYRSLVTLDFISV